MRKLIVSMMLATLLAVGMAVADEPMELSGKDFSDITMFNGTADLDVSEDLGGTSLGMMGIDESFVRDNPEDGKPINQSKPVLKLGSSTGYDRTAWYQDQLFFTPADMAVIQNSSACLEFK